MAIVLIYTHTYTYIHINFKCYLDIATSSKSYEYQISDTIHQTYSFIDENVNDVNTVNLKKKTQRCNIDKDLEMYKENKKMTEHEHESSDDRNSFIIQRTQGYLLIY